MPPLQSFLSVRDRLTRLLRGSVKAGDPAQIVRLTAAHNDPIWPRLDVIDQQAEQYLRSS